MTLFLEPAAAFLYSWIWQADRVNDICKLILFPSPLSQWPQPERGTGTGRAFQVKIPPRDQAKHSASEGTFVKLALWSSKIAFVHCGDWAVTETIVYYYA